MESLAFDLATILDTVQAHGEFYASGTFEGAAPILEVEGEGRIALPLLADQAERLIALAEPAPFGRGEQTVVDPAVRRSWQIAPDRVRLSGRSWVAAVDAIINRAAAGLGVSAPVAAERYKLLIDKEGSFFVPHRDTEKSEGMFATLVLVFPSMCQGGQLLIRHGDQDVSIDLNRTEPGDVAYAAFYADCLHELRPVTSGYRLTLIYNLLRYGDGPMPRLPDYHAQSAALGALLQRWCQARPEEGAPTKLIYPLEHAYTPAELCFASLKHADAAAAATLLQAAQQADCDVHVALLSIEESGSAEYRVSRYRHSRSYRHGRRAWDDEDEKGGDDEFEIGEIIDSSCTLSHWRRADAAPCHLTTLPFIGEEVCPPDLFDDMEPDVQHFYGATGNEGATFERSYQRAALVLWPRAQRLAVQNQGGLSVTLPLLKAAVQTWQRGTPDLPETHDVLWQEAHMLVGLILGSWRQSHRYRSGDQALHAMFFLDCLVQLQDAQAIAAFLNNVLATGLYHGDENVVLPSALAVLHPDQAVAALDNIMTSAARNNLQECTNLLLRVAQEPALCQPATVWHPVAQRLLAMMLEKEAANAGTDGWSRPAEVKSEQITDLLDALVQLQAPHLTRQLLDHALANLQRFDIDKVLLPTVLILQHRGCAGDPAVNRLRYACVTHLRTRIAQPLAAPLDFRRPAQLACGCSDCVQLAHFLDDPKRSEWQFPAPEQRRNHVEGSALRSKCDLDLRTLTQGRPYTLLARKNQASHERRVAQRQNDLHYLTQLVPDGE